jgi:thymidylate synthase
MAKVDNIYAKIIRNIDKFGSWDKDVRPKWSDGTPAFTKSILNVQMKFNNGKEIPMLTSKRVPMLDPIREALWIWLYKSNDVRFL